jgi:hypothetical protein
VGCFFFLSFSRARAASASISSIFNARKARWPAFRWRRRRLAETMKEMICLPAAL